MLYLRLIALFIPLLALFLGAGSVARAVAQEPIPAGSEVEVTGVGDCLNARWDSNINAPIHVCLLEGSRARVDREGGSLLDERWLHLAGYGWSVERYLRATAPPEPDLQSYAGQPPTLPGLVALVGRDNNISLANTAGRQWKLTTDGGEAYPGIGYSSPTWSADGRFLAFARRSPRPNGTDDLFMEIRVEVFDLFRWSTRVIEPDAGRDMWVFGWADGSQLLAVDGIEKSRNGCPSPPHDHQIISIDVVTGERSILAHSSPRGRFIGRIGALSPDGQRISFSENSGCEGGGFACAAAIGGSTNCIDEFGWVIEDWISNTELLLRDAPYTYPASGSYRPQQIWDTTTGNLRIATEEERSRIPGKSGPLGGVLEFDEIKLDYALQGRTFLHIPAQQTVTLPAQALAPDEGALLFRIYRFRLGERAASDAWLVLTDGSRQMWLVAESVEGAAWQPVVPVHPILKHLDTIRRTISAWLNLAAS